MSARGLLLGVLAYVVVMAVGDFLLGIRPTFREALLVVVATMATVAAHEARP